MAIHNGNALRESANPGNVAERSLHRGRSLNIGKLPSLIQDELNSRIFRDESSTTLLRWLNYLPQVVAAMRDHFEGNPISPQNLSEWRRGGYLQWLIQSRNVVRQRSQGGPLETKPPEPYNGPFDDEAVIQAEVDLRRAQAAEQNAQQAQAERQERAAALARRAGRPTSSDEFHDQIDSLYEDAAELGDDVIRAKDLLRVITARYAELLQDWGKIPEADFDRRIETLQQLTKNIAVVRRLEQNDERLDFLREKERNKSRSASSRPARASSTRESAPKNRPDAQPVSNTAAGASQCGASFQPASAAEFTNSAPIHQSAPSPNTADESDMSTPSDKNTAQNAHPASAGDATPSGSALAAIEPPPSHPIPPTNYSQFPPNSRDRRSRFGLL